jgi:hypothetical protein
MSDAADDGYDGSKELRVVSSGGELAPRSQANQIAKATRFGRLRRQIEKIEQIEAMNNDAWEYLLELPGYCEQELARRAKELAALPLEKIREAWAQEAQPATLGMVKNAIKTIMACAEPETKDPETFAVACMNAVVTREPSRYAVHQTIVWITEGQHDIPKWKIADLLKVIKKAERHRENLDGIVDNVEARMQNWIEEAPWEIVKKWLRSVYPRIPQLTDKYKPYAHLIEEAYDALANNKIVDGRMLGEGAYQAQLVKQCAECFTLGPDDVLYFHPDGVEYLPDVRAAGIRLRLDQIDSEKAEQARREAEREAAERLRIAQLEEARRRQAVQRLIDRLTREMKEYAVAARQHPERGQIFRQRQEAIRERLWVEVDDDQRIEQVAIEWEGLFVDTEQTGREARARKAVASCEQGARNALS